MIDLKIGNRTVPLYYSTYEMIAIQKEIGCTAFQLREEVFGIGQEDEDDPKSLRVKCAEDVDKVEKLCTLIRILGNAGLEESGKEPDLTDKWIKRHMKPVLINHYAVAAAAEILEGNKLESPAMEHQNEPVDEGLEEENAKKQPGN